MPNIVHFEIPADDIERARRFYVELFGWEIKKIPGMDYWFISPGEKTIGGGMMKRADPGQTITNYVEVHSIDEYSRAVENLGGRVKKPKQAVPGMGYFAICLDPEGNTFGIWEVNEEAK
jgi:predicted enzyme related to lactoylglutathione lyase